MSKVIKKFKWSEDGYTTQRLNVGDERDFGDATASLVEAGFVEAAKVTDAKVNSNDSDTSRQSRPNNTRQRKA